LVKAGHKIPVKLRIGITERTKKTPGNAVEELELGALHRYNIAEHLR